MYSVSIVLSIGTISGNRASLASFDEKTKKILGAMGPRCHTFWPWARAIANRNVAHV